MRRTSSSDICPPRLGATRAMSLSLVRRTSCRASKLKSSAAASIQVSGLADGPVQQVVGGDQMLIDGVAQVRQIDAAERPVPVAAIALAAIELGAGLLDQLGVDRVAGRGRGDRLLQPPADHHHAAVHLVGFGILHLEVPPEPAADERPQRRPARIVLHLAGDPLDTRPAARSAAPIRSSRGSCNRADRPCPPAGRCRTPRPAWSLESTPGSAPGRRRTAPASRRRRRASSFPARCRTSRRRRRRRRSRRDARSAILAR